MIALSGATTGKIAVVGKNIKNALVNQRVGKFKILTSKIFPAFFYYLAQSDKFKKFILQNIGQSAQGNLSPNRIKKLQIPLPPLPEQRRIAGVLRTVDEAIEKVDEEIEHTERLKRGLMQHLLTRGIGHARFKDTPIGKIPEEWEVVRLGEVARLESGGTPNRKRQEYWVNGTIPWLKSGELKDSFIYDSEEKITVLALKNSSAKLFPKGTLLVALYGATVARTGILSINAATNQAICAIMLDKSKLDSLFLQYYLIFKREFLITKSSGGAQPNIYLYVLRNFPIPLPPLPEQRKIAEILMTVDRKLELLRQKRDHLERLKKGLMNDLLTGRRRLRVSNSS